MCWKNTKVANTVLALSRIMKPGNGARRADLGKCATKTKCQKEVRK